MAAESTAEDTQTLPVAEATGEEESKPSAWQRFRRWRSGRPFFPGLLLILSGIIIAAPAYITIRISDLLVMISTSLAYLRCLSASCWPCSALVRGSSRQPRIMSGC